MQRVMTLTFGGLLFAAGLAGFFIVRIPNVVQLDLFQSLLYLVGGACGIKIGLSKELHYQRYLKSIGIGALILLALGLTTPNLKDIIHLEVVENLFHFVTAVVTLLIAEPHFKQVKKSGT